MTRTLSAAQFKATCLKVLDRVADTGHSVTVTKRGKPVARVVPVVAKPQTLVGALQDEIAIVGDIVAPVNVRWKAVR